MSLSEKQQSTLKEVAWKSIRTGLHSGHPYQVTSNDPTLQHNGASFVTLEKQQELRGCIGSLEAHESLIQNVANNSFNAAFRDPRFPAVDESELSDIELQVSVLTAPEDMSFTSEQDLLQQLKPGLDGIIFEDGFNRATFLPQVWEQLPTAKLFMAHLKNKAGLPENHWSPSVRIQRYQVEKF